jgi:hypothetical protein
MVTEGEETSPLAVNQREVGASPIGHPKMLHLVVPYVEPSWRQWPQWRWLSRTLCVFGNHHWMKSKSLGNLPISCAICGKKTKHWNTYIKLAKKHFGA